MNSAGSTVFAQLTSFDDFIDARLANDSPSAHEQEELVHDAARGLRPARLRRVQGHHRRAAQRGRLADQRLPRATERHDGRQRRGCRHRRRMARRIDAAARVRDLGDAVRGLYSQCVAPAFQRPLLHLELSAGVLFAPGLRVGKRTTAPVPSKSKKANPTGTSSRYRR